jgi:FMN-dependent oxidoreductase (nitrilotriacetate monooxygenase family)
MSQKMRLVAVPMVSPVVQHHGMWRHPETDNRFLDPASYEHLARVLEQGCFDCVFFADGQGFYAGDDKLTTSDGSIIPLLDPMQILAIMARVTTHLGLGATLSTTFIPPYLLARYTATLDMISGGRAAWNVVTSTTVLEAQNFGMDDLAARASRYDYADEVLEACFGLWKSWEDGVFIMDKESGRFADFSKVHATNYVGKHVKTRGPLTVPRSPQDHPVIMQAGASERGRQFAARWAEMIFTVQYNLKGMQDFYQDVKGRLDQHGRKPEDCLILPSINIIVAETESIAREKQAYVDSLVTDEQGFSVTSGMLGFDVTEYPLDEPIKNVELEAGSRGVFDVILQGSESEGLTLRQAARRFATTAFTPMIVGTPSQVADEMQHYFENGGCDGFILNPVTMPGSFEQVVRMVVPELQRRGLFRKEYKHKTLRETMRTGE